MGTDPYQPVRVSRRIEAPPAVVFGILADPRQHLALDGSDMLRGAVTTEPVTGTGDVFVMKMYVSRLGDYEMSNQRRRVRAGPADRLGARGRPRSPGRGVRQHESWRHRAGALGSPVELRARRRRTRRDRRHRDLRPDFYQRCGFASAVAL
jgi:hypothetical protein